MGTVLGLLFIVAAAAAGVFVGTRPTVMDGRWIAAKLEKNAQQAETAIECDREIPVGVKGAEFGCVHSRRGAHQRVWYRMSRDGKLERTRASRVQRDDGEPRGRPAPRDEEGPGGVDGADGADGDLDGEGEGGAVLE